MSGVIVIKAHLEEKNSTENKDEKTTTVGDDRII